MKKKPSPFLVTLRVAGYCALLSTALACFLFSSSTTPEQMILTGVVLALLLILSPVVGFHFGMKRYHAKMQAADRDAQRQRIETLHKHYPASAAVERYIHTH